MKHPTLTPVKSSNIQSVGHSNDGLFVRFQGGSLYCYPEAPREVYDEMLKAESAGKFFTANVRGKYAHLPVDNA